MEQVQCTTTIREPWNKGKLVGQKAPFRLKEIWTIRVDRHSVRNPQRSIDRLVISPEIRYLSARKLREIFHGPRRRGFWCSMGQCVFAAQRARCRAAGFPALDSRGSRRSVLPVSFWRESRYENSNYASYHPIVARPTDVLATRNRRTC